MQVSTCVGSTARRRASWSVGPRNNGLSWLPCRTIANDAAHLFNLGVEFGWLGPHEVGYGRNVLSVTTYDPNGTLRGTGKRSLVRRAESNQLPVRPDALLSNKKDTQPQKSSENCALSIRMFTGLLLARHS